MSQGQTSDNFKPEIETETEEELDKLASQLSDNLKFRESNEKLNKSLKIKLSKYGTDSLEVAQCLSSMAKNCLELKLTTDAITYTQKALENFIKHNGDDGLELLKYYDILAKSNLEHNNHIEALSFTKKMRKILNKHDEKEHRYMLEVHLNFALVYLGFKYYHKMLMSCQVAATLAEKLFGSKSKEMARVEMAYGLYYVAKVERHKSGVSFTKAFNILNEISSEPSKLKSECLRMSSYQYIGDHEHPAEAEKFIKEGLDMHISLFGHGTQIEECTFYESLGQYYMFKNDLKTSLEHFEKAMKLAEEILGVESSEYIRVSELLAVYYTTQEDFAKALESSQRSLEIKLKIYGENSFNVAESYLEQGEIYLETEADDESIKCFIKASKILEELFGNSHPLLAFCQFKIGELTRLMAISETEESDLQKVGQIGIEYYQVGIDLVQKLLEEDTCSVLESDVLPTIVEISIMDELLSKVLVDEKGDFEKLREYIKKYPELVEEVKDKIMHVFQEAEESGEMVTMYFKMLGLI